MGEGGARDGIQMWHMVRAKLISKVNCCSNPVFVEWSEGKISSPKENEIIVWEGGMGKYG